MCFVVDWMNDEVAVMINYSRVGMLAESMFELMGFHKADMFLMFHYSLMSHKMSGQHRSGHLGIWKVCLTARNK